MSGDEFSISIEYPTGVDIYLRLDCGILMGRRLFIFRAGGKAAKSKRKLSENGQIQFAQSFIATHILRHCMTQKAKIRRRPSK